MASLTQWTSFGKLWELVMDREDWCAVCGSWGCKESAMTEQLNWYDIGTEMSVIVL